MACRSRHISAPRQAFLALLGTNGKSAVQTGASSEAGFGRKRRMPQTALTARPAPGPRSVYREPGRDVEESERDIERDIKLSSYCTLTLFLCVSVSASGMVCDGHAPPRSRTMHTMLLRRPQDSVALYTDETPYYIQVVLSLR